MKYLSRRTIKKFKNIFCDDIINIILDYHKQVREQMKRNEIREKLYKDGCITNEEFNIFMKYVYETTDFSDSEIPECCEECEMAILKSYIHLKYEPPKL